jgi:hypothetical protein
MTSPTRSNLGKTLSHPRVWLDGVRTPKAAAGGWYAPVPTISTR